MVKWKRQDDLLRMNPIKAELINFFLLRDDSSRFYVNPYGGYDAIVS